MPTEKSRVELRIDPALHERLKALAKAADISVNQLIEGVVYWAAAHAQPGVPRVDDYEHQHVVASEQKSGAIWFGYLSGGEMTGMDSDGQEVSEVDPGRIYFQLDFTVERAVRADYQPVKRKSPSG